MSTDAVAAAVSHSHAIPNLCLVAQHFVGMALQNDYLSNGRGHLQSHRAMVDRLGPRASKLTPTNKTSRAGSCGRSFSDAEQQYLARVSTQPRLSSAKEYQLAKRMRNGDTRARNALIEANLGLVVMFARRHARPGLPLLDLVAEGNLGLFASADRFDPEMGFRFATYAKWWVLHGIRAAVKRFAQGEGMGHDDDAAEPSKDPGLEVHACDTPLNTRGMQTTVSEAEPPYLALCSQRNDFLHRALETLTPRDRAIVSARFALAEDEEQTLAVLAHRFELSIERVRQIERAALNKLGQALSHWGVSAEGLF